MHYRDIAAFVFHFSHPTYSLGCEIIFEVFQPVRKYCGNTAVKPDTKLWSRKNIQ